MGMGISVINHHSTRPITAKMRTVTREASTATSMTCPTAAAAKTKTTTRAQVVFYFILFSTNGYLQVQYKWPP